MSVWGQVGFRALRKRGTPYGGEGREWGTGHDWKAPVDRSQGVEGDGNSRAMLGVFKKKGIQPIKRRGTTA